MTRFRFLLKCLVAVQLLLLLVGAGWRVTRPAVPLVNLSRLPPTTAEAVEQLQSQMWTDTGARWQELGEAYLAFGYFAEARYCLEQAVERLPRSYAARFAYASSFERLGQLSAANEQFTLASELSLPGSRESQSCLFRIGRNALRQGGEEPTGVAAAEAALRKAFAIPAAQCALARLLVRSGRPSEALPIIEQLRADRELDVYTELAAVQAFRALGRPQDEYVATERAERAERRFSLNDHWALLMPIRARYGLEATIAQVEQLGQAGRMLAAAELFNRSVMASPDSIRELFISAGIQLDFQAGKPDKALEKLDWLSQRMDLPPKLRHMRGLAWAKSKQTSEATAELQLANSLLPMPESFVALRELTFNPADRSGEATLHFGRQMALGVQKYRSNDLPGAQTELRMACQLNPLQPRPWFYLGRTCFALGQWTEAQAAAEKCLELDPRHTGAQELLQRIQARG
jgi:tetratricopeptide (TPR) repeat protein